MAAESLSEQPSGTEGDQATIEVKEGQCCSGFFFQARPESSRVAPEVRWSPIICQRASYCRAAGTCHPGSRIPRPSGLRSIGRPPHQLLQLFPGIPINLVDWQRRFSEE